MTHTTPSDDTRAVAVDAAAWIDHADDPERPLTVEVEIPRDLVDDLEHATDAIKLRVRADE